MSINSPDLHVLVARSSDTDKISALREKSGQVGVETAGIGQKVEAEKAQHRVQNTPKAEDGKINRDGRHKHDRENQKQSKGNPDTRRKENAGRRKGGHLIDIKI